jgi:1-acyl-sn-glycerol-3-phosphate acyltransferase
MPVKTLAMLKIFPNVTVSDENLVPHTVLTLKSRFLARFRFTFVAVYYLLQPFRVLWKVWFFLFFTTSLIVLYPLLNWALDKAERWPRAFRIMQQWAWWLLTVPGIWMKVHQTAPLPNTPFIICPNHSSYVDIITMYRTFKDYFIFMGKMELNNWPLFHIFFSKGMNISVDRASITGAQKAYDRAKDELDKGHNIVIFPEGTIPPGAPKLKVFKNGAFKLAIEKNVPIVPVTFLTNFRRLQAGPALRNLGGPGPSEVIIHAPIYPKDYAESGANAMRNDTFAIIEKPLLERYGNQ